MMTETRPTLTAVGDEASDVALATAGDTRAFERLYRRHAARVHSLARRMVGTDLADEATQEAFVRAWQKLGGFRGDAAFGTWLYRLATNVMLTRLSTMKTERGRFNDEEGVMENIPSKTTRPDLAMDFEAAIDQLPRGARQVFVLHDVEGYRHTEIATMLRIAAGTSKAQLHRARMILREHLER